MAERYVVIFNGTSDARYGADRTNANAAFIGSDSSDSYLMKYRKNGTLKKLVDEDTVLSQAATKAGFASVGDRTVRMAVTAIGGAALHAGNLAWQNPESAAIIIKKAYLDVQTIAAAAATVDVGTTTVSATTASDTLIDGLDVHSATGVFDSDNDHGTDGVGAQTLASAKWVTVHEASGDATGLVANLIIEYILQ